MTPDPDPPAVTCEDAVVGDDDVGGAARRLDVAMVVGLHAARPAMEEDTGRGYRNWTHDTGHRASRCSAGPGGRREGWRWEGRWGAEMKK